MPLDLSKFSYTPATWARLAVNPEDRLTVHETMEALRKVKQVGYLAPSA